MTYIIWASYKGKPPERIDTATDDVDGLVAEYALAFGSDWRVWASAEE